MRWLLPLLVACGAPDPGDVDATDVPEPVEPPVYQGGHEPGPATLRRLTQGQYRRALRDLVGFEPVLPGALEPDVPIDGLLAVGSASTSISARGVELYEAAAFAVADQALADEGFRARWLPCVDDEACLDALVRGWGRLAWRRPLADAEVDRVVDVAVEAWSILDDFDRGAAYGVAVLLQSPSFLFREEPGAGSPRRYTGLELASRLSFLLWDSIPDAELLDAAEAGELDTEAGLRAQAERLLDDPRARDGLAAIFEDVYGLGALERLSKDPFVFPHTSATLASAAREQTLRDLVGHVLADRDFRDVLVTRTTHVDRELAAVYGIPAPSRAGFREVELPPEPRRRGLLGQVSFLALQAHAVSSSPTLRGKFVRERLLCHEIQPPPSGVETSIPEPDPSRPTLRDRLAVHLTVPACAGCHAVTDPVGLAFENFDGIGRWRLTENDATIDPSGDLDGAPFEDAWDLAGVLRDHADVPPCLVQQVWAVATGRRPVDGEAPALDFLTETFAWSGFRVRHLLVELVAHPAFREVAGRREEAP